MSAPDCAFCQIVEGEAEASFVHQDDTVVAFMDIQPITQGHMLVAPRQHFVRMLEVPDQIAMRAFRIARMLASSSQAVLGGGGGVLVAGSRWKSAQALDAFARDVSTLAAREKLTELLGGRAHHEHLTPI